MPEGLRFAAFRMRLLGVLAAHAIRKQFVRTLALDGVDFCARSGEIHALVGENGAGKSTLINIFAGRLRPDSGEATLDGVPLRAGSPEAALRAGIAVVYQSPLLFERMTWEENLALGGFTDLSRRLNLRETARRAQSLADSLGFNLPPAHATVEQRSMAERVRLEIIRALSFNPRVLILDEPTSVLAAGELAAFVAVLRRLRAQRRIVVIVTHKLAEALDVADHITVLRSGRVVTECLAGETNETELARHMIGDIVEAQSGPTHRETTMAPILEIEQLVLVRKGRRVLDSLSLTLSAGEIMGIAGVDGNGQNELIEIMAGVSAPTAGGVRVFEHAEPEEGSGMIVMPQNRDLDGLILDMTLWENLILARALRKRFSGKYGWLKRRRASEFCDSVLKRFQINASGPSSTAATLSGGNRQRLAIARALLSAPRVIIAHDLCRGLDLHATAEAHRMLHDYAASGGAVLLISSDLEELLALCGRLAVMSRGRLSEVPGTERDPARLGLMMSGVSQ
jgi:simple sugar transport system ATP-binding protein